MARDFWDPKSRKYQLIELIFFMAAQLENIFNISLNGGIATPVAERIHQVSAPGALSATAGAPILGIKFLEVDR